MVASTISKSDSFKTALTACKIGLAGFLIPYMFLFNPTLFGEGTTLNIVWSVITAIAGVTCLAASTIGFFQTRLHWLMRVILFAVSIMLIKPGLVTDIAGIAGIGLFAVIQWVYARKQQSAQLSA